MNIGVRDDVVEVTGIKEISGAIAASFRESVKKAVQDHHKKIEIDLSQTSFLDSSGLGALISLHKMMLSKGGQILLINPSATSRQILELTRLHRTFEIQNR